MCPARSLSDGKGPRSVRQDEAAPDSDLLDYRARGALLLSGYTVKELEDDLWKRFGRTVIKSVFHINVNCTDFDRSLEFYRLLGFDIVFDVGTAEGGDYLRGLAMPLDSKNRAAILSLDPSEPKVARLDLIEWIRPEPTGQATHRPPSGDLARTGIGRLSLFTRGIDEEYQRLRDAGVEFISEPVSMAGGGFRFCCCYDPDGAVIELVEMTSS
jgi:glyoxylase I family protein